MMWWRLIVNHAGMARDVLGRAGVMIGEHDTSLAGVMSRGSGADEGSDGVRWLSYGRSERVGEVEASVRQRPRKSN